MHQASGEAKAAQGGTTVWSGMSPPAAPKHSLLTHMLPNRGPQSTTLPPGGSKPQVQSVQGVCVRHSVCGPEPTWSKCIVSGPLGGLDTEQDINSTLLWMA